VLPVPNGGRAIPDVRLSDHSPFWDAGYNALMVTDTSFMRNPHYHQMSDTVDTLDLPFLAAVVEGLDAALRQVLEALSQAPAGSRGGWSWPAGSSGAAKRQCAR
jgi:Peptidase family M28